ncbi:hypothetical protein [Actinomadura chokoriensis]|uniref:Tox-REase-7 domain-containing protein n=1 Tax=Actinomadura chokoriensis TaxID=454156 RepID=A0ABV4QT30_9ACTN
MDRAEQAASLLPHVNRLAEEHGPALKRAHALLLDGALVGPAADRLQKTLANRHDDVRSAFYAAFDAVRHLAAGAGPPRTREPYIPGAPRGTRAASAVRSGSPDALDQLSAELTRASNSWQDAAQALSEILANLGLSTAPARTISRAARTVSDQKHAVHRSRDELLKTDRQEVVQSAKTGNVLHDGWNAYVHHYLPGLGQGVKDIGLSALAGNPATAPFYIAVKPKGWLERGPVGQIQGLAQGVQHPVAFAKAVINWEEWKRDPVRAFGEAAPTIVITAVTGGTGSGSGAAARLSTALRRTGKAETATSAQALKNAAAEAPKTRDLTRQPPDTPGAPQTAPEQAGHRALPRRPGTADEPHPALTAAEKQALENYLNDLKEANPKKYAEAARDPDHNFKATKGSYDEAKISLDLVKRGIFDESYQRPSGPKQGDFIDKGIHWDIKGIHSDWPPGVPQHVRARPFPNAYNSADFRSTLLKQFQMNRGVIIDTRNADQSAINDMKRIIEQEGWGDRVIWYP